MVEKKMMEMVDVETSDMPEDVEVEALIAEIESLELSDCYHWNLCLEGYGNAKRDRNG